jgi:uncharacterized protein YjbI with pentapeptide repeats
MRGTNMRGTNMIGTNIRGMNMEDTKFTAEPVVIGKCKQAQNSILFS